MTDRIPDRGPSDPRRIFATLARHRVDYVAIGGLAVIAHGFERVTQDVDVLVATTAANLHRLAAALAGLDAEALVGEGEFAALDLSHPESLGLGNLVLRTRAGGLDVFSQVPGAADFDAISERAADLNVSGVVVRVIDRDDLIRLKVAAGRPEDLADVSALEDVRRRRDPAEGRSPPGS